MLRRPLLRRLLILSVIVLAGGAIVTTVALQPDDEGERKRTGQKKERSALSELPKLNRCFDLFAPSGNGEPPDIEELAHQVEAIRKLRFEEIPEPELISEEEFSSRTRDLLEREYTREDADTEARLLTQLGAIPADTDLYELVGKVLGEQTAGLYDAETKELLVLESGGGLPLLNGERPDVVERLTLAHELEHALADQRLGLPVEHDFDPARSDSLLARTALIEGDATLIMLAYAARHISLEEVERLSGSEVLGQSEEAFQELPYHLKRDLLWSYFSGAEFVCGLYGRGGWRAIDRGYGEPPASSDQILFPERYGSLPENPPNPGELKPPWSLRLSTELGAAPLMWLFEAPGGKPGRALPDPRALVSSWAGGEASLWVNESASALGISLLDRDSNTALCAAVAGWYASAFPDDARLQAGRAEHLVIDGEEQDAVLRCHGRSVQLGIAPELDLARRLARGTGQS
jgi:hypothetical protein